MAKAPAGARISVRVQPRASRTEIVGLSGGVLRIRLTAPPVDGAANEALLRFLGDRLGVPWSALDLAAGHTGRAKTVVVPGFTAAQVWQKLGVA